MAEPLQVVRPVPGHPALVPRRGQQAPGLVGAKKLHADAHLGRQIGRSVAVRRRSVTTSLLWHPSGDPFVNFACEFLEEFHRAM